MKQKVLAMFMAVVMVVSMVPVAQAASYTDVIDTSTGWCWPLNAKGTITSGFGPRGSGYHQGIDIAISLGTPIFAARNGIVKYAGWHSSMGYHVSILHGKTSTGSEGREVYTTYMHMATPPLVKVGQEVTTATHLGYVGSTGESSGYHLHFHIAQCTKNDSRKYSPVHNTKAQLNANYINPSNVSYSYKTRTVKASKPVIALVDDTEKEYPTKLNVGSSFGLYGSVVAAGAKITKVNGYVVNLKNSQKLLLTTDKPNSIGMDINKANLNKKLAFNTLSDGSYRLVIEATNSVGTTTWSKDFTVGSGKGSGSEGVNTGANNNGGGTPPISQAKINLTQYPTTITQGKSFGLYGKITSGTKIMRVTGQILNSKGVVVDESFDYPTGNSLNINSARLNWDLEFNKLPAGTYTLKIIAENGSKTPAVYSTNFTIKAVTPPSTGIKDGTYVIYTKVGKNMVLDVSGASKENRANVQICQYNGTNAQKWKVQKSGSYYTIMALCSNKVLDVAGGSSQIRTNVQQYQSNGTNAQKWQFVDAGNGYYYIKSALGTYLDVYDARTASGTNVWTFSLNKTNAQQWKLVPIS